MWRAQLEDAGSTFKEVAALSYANSHGIVTNGNYRATPLETLSGESSVAPLRLRDEDAAMEGTNARKRRR